jgi:hypothetical protein
MRVLVTGSRDWTDGRAIYDALDRFNGAEERIEVVIEGGAMGADRIARQWGRGRGLPVLTIEANWTFYDKSAGPVRNGWLLKYGQPDLVLAFPLPQSRGTWDMVKQAMMARVKVSVERDVEA